MVGTTGIEPPSLQLPGTPTLAGNYPNPFNPSTTINFKLLQSSIVTLSILNILGEEIDVLVSDRLPAGAYSYQWNATKFASGLYLYRLETEGYRETRKMILMK